MKYLLTLCFIFHLAAEPLSLKSAADPLKYVELKDNAVILDVGCGNGELTAAIAERVPFGQVIGIDISFEMIASAKAHFERDNLQFLQKDAEYLDFENQFDLIFSFTTLQWIQSHKAFLKEAYRGLKPSGILAITLPMGLPQNLLQAVTEAISTPEWSSYYKKFNTGWNFVDSVKYAELLALHPWIVTRLAVVPQKEVFRCRKCFAKFLAQWFPYLRPLPEELKSVFLMEVIDRYIELETPNASGEVSFNTQRLEVVASKG